MRKRISFILFFTAIFILSGCANETKPKAIKNLDFTVIAEERLPEELLTQINEKKSGSFKMTFVDKDSLYICVGYGIQSTGGYSITVNALDQLSNGIRIDTNLIGPSPDAAKKEGKSYPYIVIKTKDLQIPVIFD